MRNKIHTRNSTLLLLLFTFAIPLQAQAIDYYVDQNHPSANDQNPGTIALPWKTITKANQTLRAGDTVYIKAGTYSTYIAPANSGTPGSRITYRNYGSDPVTISGTSYAININGKSYITVQGINSTGCTCNLYIQNSANYNIIAYCTFTLSTSDWDTSMIMYTSQYNWIHHCTFSKGGQCKAGGGSGSDVGQLLDVGIEEQVPHDDTSHNLIENCTFFHAGHHVVALYGNHNVFRNNYLHNEAWSRGKGHRNLYLNGRTGAGYNLIEGNKFGYAAAPCAYATVGNVAMSTPYNIFRYNKLYFHNAYALGTYNYGRPSGTSGSYNLIYNNTIFNSGYNIDPGYDHGSEDTAMTFMHSSNTGNQIKNNLFYANYHLYTNYYTQQTYANNFNGDTQGDPKFVNAVIDTPPADKNDPTLPNLDLQSNSPAIDQGGALTTVAAGDTGSGTSLIVTDASYFQDGTWAPSGTIQADWIAVGTVGNVVQISSINYSTNTITLASPIGRSGGQPIWLYKKSDGAQVLYGSAPDPGAYEFGQSDAPSAPKNLRIIQ